MRVQDELTDNWLESCYIAYNNSGFMYEKYNALEKGVGGGGGATHVCVLNHV